MNKNSCGLEGGGREIAINKQNINCLEYTKAFGIMASRGENQTMTSVPNDQFLQYDWSKLDDLAWQQLLQDMSTADYSAIDTSQAQEEGWQLGYPSDSQAPQGTGNPQTPQHSTTDANAGRHPGDPISPPSYQRLLSAEASPETEPVPQAESYSGDMMLVEELRGLVDHLEREYVLASRLLGRR